MCRFTLFSFFFFYQCNNDNWQIGKCNPFVAGAHDFLKADGCCHGNIMFCLYCIHHIDSARWFFSQEGWTGHFARNALTPIQQYIFKCAKSMLVFYSPYSLTALTPLQPLHPYSPYSLYTLRALTPLQPLHPYSPYTLTALTSLQPLHPYSPCSP